MKPVASLFVAAAVLARGVLSTDPLVVNNPGFVVECQPFDITWTGGTGPFNLTITDSATNNMPITMQFPNIAEHNLLWPTNVLGGTVAVFEVTDATGETAFSGAVNVQPSQDTSCFK